MDPLFERRELSKKIHINSKFLQANIQGSILQQLKTNYEGICSSEGFIQPQSITILEWSMGRCNYKIGGVDYVVKFQADICLPHQGQKFKAQVSLKSKMGIHSETLPIKILIPRDLHIGNEDFENLKDKDEFEFEVIGSEFKQQDKTIYVLGRLLSALKPNPIMPLVSTNIENSEEASELPKFSSESDQKLVTIIPSQQEPDKKKRKLKKSSIDNVKTDEQTKEGMA